MKSVKTPLSIFDDLKYIGDTMQALLTIDARQDYKHAISFLKSYRNSSGTFNSYRREIEKLLQWTWFVANKTLRDLRRDDIESFIRFTKAPPKSWIGIKKATRFIEVSGKRIPNPQWRPFVLTISKAAHRSGEKVNIKDFELSTGSIKGSFAILGSFYNYLLQENYAQINPVALIRQKSKFIRKIQGQTKIRRLSELQWQYIIRTAATMAEVDPSRHERSLFILSALYSMYLRISELAANDNWIPTMNHLLVKATKKGKLQLVMQC